MKVEEPNLKTPSKPRDTERCLSETPAIQRLGSTVSTPHLQRCRRYEDEREAIDHKITVFFEEDDRVLTTTALLGKGGFGKVYAARSNLGESFALKVSSKEMSESDWKRLHEEVTLMSHFSKHPNIVKYFCAGRDDEHAYVVMEQCVPKSLHDVIGYQQLNVPEILWIGWALVNTISYIHSKGCMHRDLKPQNLLFDERGTLKITDFGLSSRISDTQPRKTVAGTAMYMAPEMANEVFQRMTRSKTENISLSYGKEVDTWSIGVVLYVLLTRMNPYIEEIEKSNIKKMEKHQKQLALFNAVSRAMWKWPPNWTPPDHGLCHLVNRILDPDPTRRATLQDVIDDAVWNRRPLSCPLSLLQKLDLLDGHPLLSSTPAGPALQAVPPNEQHLLAHDTKITTKRDVDILIREGITVIESTERRKRRQIIMEFHDAFHVLVNLLHLSTSETNSRQNIMVNENYERNTVRSEMLMTLRRSSQGHRKSSRREGSVSLLSEAAVAASSSSSSSSSMSPCKKEEGSGRGRSARISVGMDPFVANKSKVVVVPPKRQGSVAILSDDSSSSSSSLVHTNDDRYAVVFPGRERSTRWNLRSVVSMPRELNSTIEEEYKCMNRHIMTKLTQMPSNYNGFDCNVCDRAILKIRPDCPAFRCFKCDYDVCQNCAFSGKTRDVSFICPTCNKRFTTNAKLRAHSLRCTGPSISQSPRRSSRMNTMLWDSSRDYSFHRRGEVVELDNSSSSEEYSNPARDASTSRRGAARATYTRTSDGGRISLGNSQLAEEEEDEDSVKGLPHREADSMVTNSSYWEKSRRTSSVGRRQGRGSSTSAEDPSSLLNTSADFQNSINSEEDAKQQLKALLLRQPRKSGGVIPPPPPGFAASPARKVRRVEESKEPIRVHNSFEDEEEGKDRRGGSGGGRKSSSKASPPPEVNDKGMIIGIAARRRAESIEQQAKNGGGPIVINAATAEKPMDVLKQGQTFPRSATMRQQPTNNVMPPRHQDAVPQPPSTSSSKQTVAQAWGISTVGGAIKRSNSISGHNAKGGPPLPRLGPAARGSLVPLVSAGGGAGLPAPAVPPAHAYFSSMRQSRYSMAPTALVPGAPSEKGVVGKPESAVATGTAFLALPRKEEHRQQFIEDFVSGGWVRFYSFPSQDIVVIHYCLQPGRYGAIFPTEMGVGSAVIDLYTSMVIYIPRLNNENNARSQPHPHVVTYYDEEIHMLSFAEAQKAIAPVVKSIMAFVDEVNSLKAEGLTPAAVHSAYIHRPDQQRVPPDAKFVYLRKVYPMPDGSATLFKLSNLRGQVVCNTLLDIRWQCDRSHHVGQKYYIHPDGRAEPFTVDRTGVLHDLEMTCLNCYRR